MIVQTSKRLRIEESHSPPTPADFCTVTWSTNDVNTSRESSPAPELAFSRVLFDDILHFATTTTVDDAAWHDNWLSKFIALIEYGKEHGHCNVPCSYECALPDGSKFWLGEWLTRQRRYYKLHQLSDDRNHLLQLLIDHQLLSWNNLISENANAIWNTKYQCLLEYIQTQGHGDVPWNYMHCSNNQRVHLGEWVSRQRRDKKLNRLSLEHDRLLQNLVDRGQFCWSSHHADTLWYAKYKALLQYGDLNGHCNVRYAEVAIMEDGSLANLGTWLAGQKKLWRTNQLSDLKYSKLQALVNAGMLRWKV